MKTLAILGASGHGKVVADTALCADWDEVIFFDDKWPKLNTIGHWKVVGNSESLLAGSGNYDEVIVAIGDNFIRLNKINRLLQTNIPLATIVHPTAVLSSYAAIAPGSVIFANAVINMDCKVGIGCIINTGAIIEHDCTLGDGVHISPGASIAGGVHVGNISWIGIGSSVCQQIIIGTGVVVGAGAAVIENIPDNYTVVGVPAKPIRNKRV